LSNTYHTKKRRWTQLPWHDKQQLFNQWHPLCKLCSSFVLPNQLRPTASKTYNILFSCSWWDYVLSSRTLGSH